jgi:hypothetical protein
MKKLLISFLALIILGGCSLTSNLVKDVVKPEGILKDAKLAPDFDMKITLTAPDPDKVDVDAKVIVTNKKTGKSFIFSHKEFKLIINAWNNWRLVSAEAPEISKIEQDKKYIYLTFNYYKKSDDGRTKTSVLSGIIVLNKAVVFERTKTESMLIGVAAGMGSAAVILAIVMAILLAL